MTYDTHVHAFLCVKHLVSEIRLQSIRWTVTSSSIGLLMLRVIKNVYQDGGQTANYKLDIKRNIERSAQRERRVCVCMLNGLFSLMLELMKTPIRE